MDCNRLLRFYVLVELLWWILNTHFNYCGGFIKHILIEFKLAFKSSSINIFISKIEKTTENFILRFICIIITKTIYNKTTNIRIY